MTDTSTKTPPAPSTWPPCAICKHAGELHVVTAIFPKGPMSQLTVCAGFDSKSRKLKPSKKSACPCVGYVWKPA